MKADNFEKLRIKRFKNRISKRQLADKLNCSESWLTQLELHGYTGPAGKKWLEQYQNALEAILQEVRNQ